MTREEYDLLVGALSILDSYCKLDCANCPLVGFCDEVAFSKPHLGSYLHYFKYNVAMPEEENK